MAVPSVTYTFVNGPGNIIDAPQVNQNFSDLVGVLGGGSGDLSVDTVLANGLTAGTLTVGGNSINVASINSMAVSAIVAYDYTTIVQNEMSYASGTFQAVVSGISDGAGGVRSCTVGYVKNGSVVSLFIPAHSGPTDGYNPGGGATPMPWYVFTGLPAAITPVNTTSVDFPTGPFENSAQVWTKNILGDMGSNSALSCINIFTDAGYYGGSAGTKGYNRPICIVYKM